MSTKWWHSGPVGGISVPVHSGMGHLLHASTIDSANAFVERLNTLEDENARLRKILAHVPGRIAMQAKEQAGFPDYIHTLAGIGSVTARVFKVLPSDEE